MLNSQSTLEQETAGDVADVEPNINRQHKVYKILIFGDEAERTRALTQIIATPCVSVVINIGEVMDVKSTLPLKLDNSETVIIRSSKSEPSSIERRMTS